MTELTLCLFLLTALTTVLWSLWRTDRFFQFPMLTGAVWLLYLGPMAIGIYHNRDWLPDGAANDGGIGMALFMGALCCMAGFVGYLVPGNRQQYLTGAYCDGRLFASGVFLIIIAYAAFLKLAALSGGVLSYFSVEGSYKLEWSGAPVVYAFFAQLVYPGLILCLFACFQRQTLARLTMTFVATSLPLANVLVRGRRSELAALLITVGFSYFLAKRWAPPRSIVVAVLLVGAIAVLAAPVYREHSQIGGNVEEIGRIDAASLISRLLSGDDYTELHYAVVQLPATYQENEYNLGRGFYNRLVRQWVPKMIVGEEGKAALFWPGPDFRVHTLEYYGWLPQNGWIPTAIVDVFREFSFYGALLFLALGFGFRKLWNRAIAGDMGAQIFYVALAPSAMYAIVSGLTAFVAQLLFLVIFLAPLLWFSRGRGLNHIQLNSKQI